MPVSVLTSLVLWSAFLLPGAKVFTDQEFAPNPSLRQATSPLIAVEMPTIEARPIAGPTDWILSEANTEEEESSDNDDNVIVAARCWTLPRLGLIGQNATIRLDRGFSTAPSRKLILRC